MPKPYTFPLLYDDCLTINISDLKKWGYFEPNCSKGGTLSWSRRGENIGNISIRVYNFNRTSIELDYKFNDEPRNYSVSITSIPSNLGKGRILYFICPFTRKRCRKLYSVGGYFGHRDNARYAMYESQIKSKHYRNLERRFGNYFALDHLYEELYTKHFKKTYAGKPTKRYLKLMTQIEKGQSVSYHEIEMAMMK